MLDYYRIEKAINYIEENFKDQPSLEDISKELNLSPFYLQKMFKKWAGISPKKFLELVTLEHSKGLLKATKNIQNATYDSGLSSTSRLYELYTNVDAVTPKEFISEGEGMKIYYYIHECIFGTCFIAVTNKGICSMHFANEKDEKDLLNELKTNWPKADFIKSKQQTLPYIEKIFNKGEKIKLIVKGTNFQVQVWKALLAIPEGKVSSYEEIARNINSPKAVRAVGTAVGSNPISFIIPCHRVIRKSGVIGNYRWGSTRKKAILAWEMGREK